jgi:hypothetical protein
MLVRSLALVLGAAAFAAPFPEPPNNQAETIPLLSLAEALTKLHLPAGFKATLFAAEPDVRQPIALCWDERARLWIAENYTYSDGKERFDLNLGDRIIILEDTDHDGKFDKRTVFTDEVQMLTSGVYAMCPPNLLFIPMDGDKPAGPAQVGSGSGRVGWIQHDGGQPAYVCQWTQLGAGWLALRPRRHLKHFVDRRPGRAQGKTSGNGRRPLALSP